MVKGFQYHTAARNPRAQTLRNTLYSYVYVYMFKGRNCVYIYIQYEESAQVYFFPVTLYTVENASHTHVARTYMHHIIPSLGPNWN